MHPALNAVSKRYQKGFNLLELLVVLLVATLLFGIAIPAGKSILNRGHLTSATNEAYGALLFARNEASRLRQQHRLCFMSSMTATACADAPSNILGVFINTDSTGTWDKVRNFELTEQAGLSFSGVSNQWLDFEPLGSREPAKAVGTPVFLKVTVADDIRVLDVCFNGRIVIRRNSNECQ